MNVVVAVEKKLSKLSQEKQDLRRQIMDLRRNLSYFKDRCNLLEIRVKCLKADAKPEVAKAAEFDELRMRYRGYGISKSGKVKLREPA